MSPLRPLRPTRLAVPLLAACALIAVAGCGSTEPSSSAAADPTEPASITPTPTPTPTPSPTTTPTASPSATPTAASTDDQVGDGDADGKEPAAAGGGVCPELSEAAVGNAIGQEVTGAAVGGGGCRFSPSNPKAPALSVFEQKFTTVAEAKNGAISAVEGTPEDLSGIGQGAFVVTGTMFGGPGIQGVGVVHVGPRLISVTINQNQDMTRAAVRAKTVAALKLVASKL